MKNTFWKGLLGNKSKGNVADILTMGIFVLSMAVIMICFMDCIELIGIREDVSQVARKYLLVAETEGYLDNENRQDMEEELRDLGITDIDLSGTTLSRVGFGNMITIKIKGKVKDKYAIKETRASTAKY